MEGSDRLNGGSARPGAAGRGRAASHSATWRRSWPLPRRPFGARAGEAGRSSGIPPGKAGGKLQAGARFAIAQVINYRGISLGISGHNTTLSRLFRGSQRHSVSNSRIPAPTPAQFVTHRHRLNYCPPSRLSAAAGRLSRACPHRPPAASRTCPHLAAHPHGATRARASGHGGGGEHLSLYGYRATDRRRGINVRHACPARHG